MSITMDSTDSSNNIVLDSEFNWEENLPTGLREQATLVSKLASDLFRKLKVHPNVYVPCNKNFVKDWSSFHFSFNQKVGSISLNREILRRINNKKEEVFETFISIGQLLNSKEAHSVDIDQITFDEDEMVMPEELQKEAKNLVKVAYAFFRELVLHPDVIVMDQGLYMENWESFKCYGRDKERIASISFREYLDDNAKFQKLKIETRL
uniref:Uncharacterized protein n=1 Tax=Candidatus Kentrum sp. SD TaxID=2126332 RepID=A0A450Z581_9GAMM|nr:MAG: hypothetical protein BECKSD772F_GA0070984_11953 [Candidatus Kentron sp. SD]VFK48929.1 MAG: hypothetical protein BECKSD772E_GA0070983_11509 [Candidatus Kentron sp. SD]VFK80771.1 MAG: hypothetical protein BECKSD772D_GA0070982_11544 [Candidatus Kentron sp. SD]